MHKTHLFGMPSLSVLESDFKQLLAVLNLLVRRNTGFGRSLAIIGLCGTSHTSRVHVQILHSIPGSECYFLLSTVSKDPLQADGR